MGLNKLLSKLFLLILLFNLSIINKGLSQASFNVDSMRTLYFKSLKILDSISSNIQLNNEIINHHVIKNETSKKSIISDSNKFKVAESKKNQSELFKLYTKTVNSIYLDNDLHNVNEPVISSLLNDVKKVCCFVLKDSLKYNPLNHTYSMLTNSFKNQYGLCETEKFINEPVCPFCTGFAYDKSTIITAGHCISNDPLDKYYYKKVVIVFGYEVNNSNEAKRIFDERDVYNPISVKLGLGSDYAIIKIDKPIGDSRISKVRVSGKIDNNDELYVIGYPCGLPVKITTKGYITNNTLINKFYTNLDTFCGNSGSPVFNTRDNLIEGLLINGKDDFEQQGSCNKFYIRPLSAGREGVLRMTVINLK